MAQQTGERLRGPKDWLQAHRNPILYGVLVLAFLGVVVGWKLLPDPVVMSISKPGQDPVVLSKRTAVGAHFLLSAGFGAAFWFRPRELAYCVASLLGLLLTYGILYINVGL